MATDTNGSKLPKKHRNKKTHSHVCASHQFIISCLVLVPQIERPAGNPSALISCVFKEHTGQSFPYSTDTERNKGGCNVNSGYFTPTFPAG